MSYQKVASFLRIRRSQRNKRAGGVGLACVRARYRGVKDLNYLHIDLACGGFCFYFHVSLTLLPSNFLFSPFILLLRGTI